MTAAPDPAGLAEALPILEELQRRMSRRLLHQLYPDESVIDPATGDVLKMRFGDAAIGLYGRDLYPKHLEFFRAGATYRERCALAANRVGKSFGMGGFECACHLTGLYPMWWEGRRFAHPIRAWVAGDSYESARDIPQTILLGDVVEGSPRGFTGTGLIPGDRIGSATWRNGVPNVADTIRIRHVSGGWSRLGIKAYNQGRKLFQGTSQHLIWLDEEPPADVYTECLTRTMAVNGIIMLTFTPLSGMSEVVLSFMSEPDSTPEIDTEIV